MKRHFAPTLRHSLTLALLATSLACELKISELDAGIGDEAEGTGEEPLAQECMLGTLPETVGVERDSMDLLCPVTCAMGWGHDGEQLPIAWTTPLASGPLPKSPRALGVLANGRIVAALATEGAVFLNFYEPDGLNIGGYDVFDLGSDIYAVEIVDGTVYVSHGDGLGNLELRAVGVASQQELWRRSIVGDRSGKLARGAAELATVITVEGETTTHELQVFDLDGVPKWASPVSETGPVAFSPSGARLALGGERTRVYAAEDGELLDEFVHGALPSLYVQDVAFVDEDRLITLGTGLELERFDAWLAGDSLAGAPGWERVYGRADSWCPEPNEDQGASATADVLVDLAILADGSALIVGSENFQSAGLLGGQPWVAQVDAEGTLLASDRGLWNGYAAAVARGGDGSGFALLIDNDPDQGDLGHRLRKYAP
ncbi:MAG: hypothetical protein KC457_01125 [Myxococcales bacterium]|nr:hypothetical protein [Myxococcales bacterium]